MAENPPLNRIYVLGYSANDRDYPIVSLNADPRVAGYRIPEDLSTCPDKRYPNHVFTGAQPLSGDERVRHVWEILPSPWVPFTRYDDDLGPVQGRRRSVKNEGQVASREADKQVTYEAREGSAIVYTELEETWSIKTDEDGNSLFPIRDRDFYDPSRGPIQERRQIFVPTGEEAGSLENVNGVITQTSYEPYNDFLSVKIVQTYKVDGPQLIGKATDNEGQLVTITTQRKAADGYVPTTPTATRTVEANREDAESLVERIVDTPQVFGAEVYRKTREDITPQKFKAAQEDTTAEQNIEGTANPSITLATGEFAKSEQQVSKFVKRVSTTTRDIDEAVTLVERVLTNEGQIGTRILNLQAGDQSLTPSATTVDGSVEALGDGRTVKSETIVPNVFSGQSVVKTKVDLTPEKFRAAQQDTTTEESLEGVVNTAVSLGAGEFRKSEQQVTEFVKRVSSTTRDISAATDLTETIVTNQGQLATRTLRLSAQAQSIQPDALLVDGSIEALGDGRTVKSETKVGEVFPQTLLRVEKPVTIPERFLTGSPTTTEAETTADEAPSVEIAGDVISQQVERTGVFTARKTTTERNLSNLPQLNGVDYDQTTNTSIPFTEYISTTIPDGPCEADPIGDGKILVKEYDLDSYEQNLSDVMLSFPTRSTITGIPPKLKKFEVLWELSESEDNSVGGSDASGEGSTGSIGGGGSSRAKGSVSAIPKFIVELEEINGSNIPTTSYFFFLKYPVTLDDILAKVGASAWPVFKPKSYVVTAYGQTATGSLDTEFRFQSNWASTSSSRSNDEGAGFGQSISNHIASITIPSCLCSGFSQSVNTFKEKVIVAQIPTLTIGGSGVPENNIPINTQPRQYTVKAEYRVQYNLSPTSPSEIPPTGTYLINSSVEPYKFGIAKVYAEVVNSSVFA